jgi:hypothetical protein
MQMAHDIKTKTEPEQHYDLASASPNPSTP